MFSGRNEGSKDDKDDKFSKHRRKGIANKALKNCNSTEDFNSDTKVGTSGNSNDLSSLSRDKVRISLSLGSKDEALELRKRLESERDMIRSLMRKIEAYEGKKISVERNEKVMNSGVGPPRMSKPLSQLSVSVVNESNNVSRVDGGEKEKRTPKANKYYGNSDFLLAKDKLPNAESHKKVKAGVKKDKFPNQVMKSCSAVLERLMRHKHGWVFNKPVDAVALGLHDYFDIIKNPMDLGTVKERLTKNVYESPMEFAEDVRLTFSNAMTYNLKGQDVYVMAEQLSNMFEEKWGSIEADYKRELKNSVDVDAGSPKPPSRKNAVQPNMKKAVNTSIVQPSKVRASKKPKARDPVKRDMTYDEKQKLSVNLQNLPPEKLEHVVQIIKKRDPSVSQQDDEIEVDIDTFDTETLWELDRFITNYKKSSSKNKRKAEIVGQLIDARTINEEKINAPDVSEILKRSRTDDAEKVVSPHVEVEEAGDNDVNKGASLSSSSSGSVSSFSDSDGESSLKDGPES